MKVDDMGVERKNYKLFWVSWHSLEFYDDDPPPFQVWVIGNTLGKNRRGETIFTWQALIRAPSEDHVIRAVQLYFGVAAYILFCHPTTDLVAHEQFTGFENRTALVWDEDHYPPMQTRMF